MVCLGEREVGFDPDCIGFPSIDGCHGVVLVTASGLWGFHNFGGSGVSSFAERSQSFATFVSQHFVTRGVSSHLYGTCFRNKRGYADANKLSAWKAEMKAFASALGYKGTVSGYNLDQVGYGAKSAYVEYRRNGGTCTVSCKPWVDMSYDQEPLTNRVNHKRTQAGGVKPISTKVYLNIKTKDSSALHTIGPNQFDSFTV
jgi:hypothetical protein